MVCECEKRAAHRIFERNRNTRLIAAVIDQGVAAVSSHLDVLAVSTQANAITS